MENSQLKLNPQLHVMPISPSEQAQHLANYILQEEWRWTYSDETATSEVLAGIIQEYWDSLL